MPMMKPRILFLAGLVANLVLTLVCVGIGQRGGVEYLMRKSGLRKVQPNVYETDHIIHYFKRVPVGPSDTVIVADSILGSCPTGLYFRGTKNFGIGGIRTEDVLETVDWLAEQKPSRAVVALGLNDLFNAMPSENSLANFRRIIRAFHRHDTTRIVVLSVLPFNYSIAVNAVDISTKIQEFNRELEECCRQEGVRYIDLTADFIDKHGRLKADYTFDGYHLNYEGQFRLMEALARKEAL